MFRTWAHAFCRCAKGVWVRDWQKTFGHPVVLLETFVDPQRFRGTVYKAANWLYVGNTQRISPDPPRVHGYASVTQNGFRQTLAGRCPRAVMPGHSHTTLSYRRLQNHAQRRSDAIPTLLFCRNSRSPPRPRTTASIGHGSGHCSRGHPVWDARIPGDLGLGQEPRPKGPGAFRLPLRQRAVTSSPASPSSAMS